MAVTLNPGTGGEVIATEDVAGEDYQQVKLVDGTATSTTVIAAGNGVAANAMRVTVASDSTGVVSVDDNGGSLTVDGTVTANLSATDNAVLDSIDTAVNGTLGVSGTVTANLSATDNAVLDTIETNTDYGTVTGGGVEAGALRVTMANNSTGVLSVDDNGGSLTVDSADLSTLAGAVSGTEMQVDIVSGAVAGTEYTEDAVVPANPAGPAIVAERDDALSTLTPAAGDWTHLRTDSTGALWVNAVNADGTNNIGTAAGATDSGVPVLAIRDDALTTLSDPDGDYVGLRVNSTGALHVTGGGGGTEYTVDAAAPAAPTGTASLMERDDALSTLTEVAGDWVQERCNANGAKWVAVDGAVTVDLGANNDVTVTSGAITETNSGAILADTASMDTNLGAVAGAVAGTEMQVDVVAALPAGTNNIGDVDIATIAAGTTLIGDVGLSGARTTGGTTIYRNVDADETEDQIKATAGQVYWIHAMNMTAAVLYLQFYNATAASVTVGTTTPDLTFPLATLGDTNGAGFTLSIPNGIEFGTAITVAATTTIAGAAGPAANGCIVNLGYA